MGTGIDLPLDTVLRGDCIETLQRLPPASVHAIFADPPYNLQLRGALRRPDDSTVDGVDAEWDRFADLPTYDAFTRAWLSEARRVLRRDGTLWVMGAYHNIFRLGTALQDLGYWILNDVVWRKSNPMPNFRGRRFTNAHETLIWAARGPESRYRFNYAAMKAENGGKQMRSDWLFPLCTGAERLRGPDGRKLHPTQKPEALLERVVLASTAPGEIILDPFLGTGTTAAVAKRLGRRYVGIEREDLYADAAEARIAAVEAPEEGSLPQVIEKRDQPRVPFITLVDRGLVPAGTKLWDRHRRWAAEVTREGTLKCGRAAGSIHQVGAQVQEAPSCNGWTFWHLERRDGSLRVLDELRAELAPAG